MTSFVVIGLLVLSVSLFAIAAATLWWMLHAWRTPAVLRTTGFDARRDEPRHSFSLLVPARHEEAVLGHTLDQLAQLDHPSFEILAIVGHDDDDTRAVAEQAAARHRDRVRVVIDHNWPKNKPKALNTALPECRGDIVGVFDAEDEVDRRLLRQVDTCFVTTDAHVVQGGVQLVNFQSSWYSLRNCLEYFFWFRSRLHLHAQHRFIPLGGNTVFVRRDLLQAVEGWDAECLAEDCELGVRLSALGARVEVAYDPRLVTREETPPTLVALFKQRTRWNQGFLQVLNKGMWRELPTRRQRMLARYTLAMPFLQAITGIAIPISLVAMWRLHAPVAVALLSFLPAVPTLATLAFEAAGLREFGRLYYVRPRWTDYLRLVVSTFVYQVVLAAAALRAVGRELRGARGWEKTAHVGAHRGATDVVDLRVARPVRPATDEVPA